MSPTKEYTARPDSKRRVTLRGASYPYYQVKEYEHGCILLEPRELSAPDTISARTLADMDRAVANFSAGRASGPIDLSAF